MQNISPRQYFETRLRKLPILKCVVNKEWKDEKMAQVMVLRQHVNGNVSGANFLVDLLCLGVKDATWFFNTDADEMTEIMEDSGLNWIEVPYALAHNIVYAGLEFAGEYHIKPHPDFAIAKYALEEDEDAIELIDIETGENGMPHLLESYPGQYADAHSKLKKYAGEGNYQISLAIIKEDGEEEDDDLGHDDEPGEADWDDEWEDDEEDWDDEEEEIPLNEISLGELTVYEAMRLPVDDLFNLKLLDGRTEWEQLIIHTERVIRLYESVEMEAGSSSRIPGMNKKVSAQIEQIKLISDEEFMDWIPYPNGCDEHDYEQGMEGVLNQIKKLSDLTVEEKSKHLDEMLQSTGEINPWVLAQCIFYLLADEDGPALLETLTPHIFLYRHYPLVSLAQTFLVTAEPELFPQSPLLNSNSPRLKEICKDFPSFSFAEYCLFYALRCLQALKQNNIPLMATWYRLMVETDEADLFGSMLTTLQFKMMIESEGFVNGILAKS